MRSRLAAFTIFGFLGFGTDTVNFDNVKAGSLPPLWSVAANRPNTTAKWQVRADASAPSRPNVLEQVSSTPGETDSPLAIFDKVVCRDGELSVKFKIEGGRRFKTAGVVWRYQDPANYYLLDFSADEQRVAMYHVLNGKPVPVPPFGAAHGVNGVPHEIQLGEWYVVKVVFRGPQFRVLFGNRRLFEAEDSTLTKPGRTGIWTRGRTNAEFDDFRIDKKG